MKIEYNFYFIKHFLNYKIILKFYNFYLFIQIIFNFCQIIMLKNNFYLLKLTIFFNKMYKFL
jgi:hypothetical protein